MNWINRSNHNINVAVFLNRSYWIHTVACGGWGRGEQKYIFITRFIYHQTTVRTGSEIISINNVARVKYILRHLLCWVNFLPPYVFSN